MTSWDIDPAGVRGVLGTVDTHAKSLSAGVTSLSTHLESAGGACGKSIVALALSNFVDARTPELTTMGDRINSAFTGTVNAVTAYLNGDEEMAATAQASAVAAPSPTYGGPAGNKPMPR